ncbi:amino acid adenylation domain-containing protein [Lentzea sp. NEAU-D13]|uniref:Amino acid adenylation domain-containing protein n=1 Tax=Lentzea alba TaxID=2714351 RepID=A0A7C9W0Z1_9PSEU|nr:non-ribosomal peptide synthetase [Lentzea alba]NGY62597.1 amino acid adenylation domain-containing protein [Lentzea alba]
MSETVWHDVEAPSWGFGGGEGTGTHQIAVPGGGDEAAWQAALAVVLRRYDPEAETPCAELVFTAAGRGAARSAPLTVSVLPDGEGTVLRCDYLRAHFAPEIASAFLHHLAHVHRQLLDGTPEAEVELMDAAEQQRVAALGRPRDPLVTTPTTIHEAFARVAATTPDAIALCDTENRLTYRELDRRATALAGGLHDLGVRAGDRVGVCLERTAELVVTLLGVLKAGATYVPTDPAYPADRLRHTVEDAGLGVVITRREEFPAAGDVVVVPPDALDSVTEVVVTTTPADPAYVIYTSGSTGRPKGVVIPHRNVISLVDAARAELDLDLHDVWSLFHSSAFDVSVFEMWGCLLTGGRLVVVPYFVSREPEEFRDLLEAEEVTVLSQTPSAFTQLLPVVRRELSAVRLVLFAGEPLDTRMLLPWMDLHPRCELVNLFGITETTVHTTVQVVTREDALAASRSVGPALPGWHLYVMDEAGRLVPPGVIGEIVVGGAGVALHYLGREDLTAQRFRPDPFAGGTMYRSGDLGRLRPDGALEHLGRMDGQVKIRGFRIELDEIRAVLLEDPDVRAAAVVVRRDDPATPRLDAYVVLTGGDATVVRKRAATVLPDYMVPATVTPVAELPLTTNGKLDHKRLPAPVRPSSESDAGELDPVTARIRAIWAELLGTPVGVDDNFFDLGGNSHIGVRIGAALRAAGFPSVRLRELYQNPTVRGIAALVNGQLALPE